MPSSHLILCRPLFLLPPIPPSIRVFSNESVLSISWPKYWNCSFSIIPSKEHPGLIFRMDWLDLLAVQGTLMSLLQNHSSKPSILLRSAFLIVLSHPYTTTGNTIALTWWTFVGKVMSLLRMYCPGWSQLLSLDYCYCHGLLLSSSIIPYYLHYLKELVMSLPASTISPFLNQRSLSLQKLSKKKNNSYADLNLWKPEKKSYSGWNECQGGSLVLPSTLYPAVIQEVPPGPPGLL